MFIMAIIWRVMTFSKLTRLLWLCIFLVQLWKAKQVTITPWSILNTYTSGFNKNLKNLYIVFYSYKLQHKHDITSSCPYFIQTGQFCVKNMQITQFIPASGRSEKTTPPQDVKTYTSSKDWAIYMPKQRATGKQNAKRQLTSVPDLSLDSFSINLYTSGSKFHTDCGLGLQIKFVSRKPRQQIWLPNTGVTYENNYWKMYHNISYISLHFTT